jgi:hypothetical protein
MSDIGIGKLVGGDAKRDAIHPAGCACTQAARREREIEENKKAGQKLAEIFAAKLAEPPLKPGVKVRPTPKEPGESYIKSLAVELDGDDDRDPIERAQDILSTRCAAPGFGRTSSTGS